jgi:hypothetical protein
MTARHTPPCYTIGVLALMTGLPQERGGAAILGSAQPDRSLAARYKRRGRNS